MYKDWKDSNQQTELDAKKKINDDLSRNIPLSSKEMVYKCVGIGLIVLGLFAGIALRYLIGYSPIIGISFAACLSFGVVVMHLGDRMRAKRIKSLPPII